jgi:hypothetical protein
VPRRVPLRALLALAVCAGLAGCELGVGDAAERSAPPRPRAAPPPPTTAPSPAPTVVPRGDGDLHVVPGTSAPSGTGRRTPYVVEVEGGLGVEVPAFVAEVERVLADPRSWGAGGRRSFQRVPGGDVRFRVALASPATTDRLCAPLDTAGRVSCANGDRAVLNAARWVAGARSYAGHLHAYRAYVVNHEVGHALGRGHQACPGPGAPAPVMLQQTLGLDGCEQNPWPYP